MPPTIGSSGRTSVPPRLCFVLLLPLALLGGCGRSEPPSAVPSLTAARPTENTAFLRREPIGAKTTENPWITHVAAVDLDRDGLVDAVGCEGRRNEVFWIRQTARGQFEERVLAGDMRAPVHVEAVDFDGDTDLDLLVASMSVIFPNNDKIGAIIILENDGSQQFRPHVILENVARVTDVRAADFNGDGKLDLAVAQFGYDQGEVRWMERTGPWEFRSHNVLDLSGTINVVCADFNGDKTTDFAALASQQWEEIHLFENDGKGGFSKRVLWGSTNEDFATSGMVLSDLNRDGRPDLVFTNGDGFGPSAVPGPRPWHGVQWLENVDGRTYKYHRIGALPGAYSPACADFDGDGRLDVVALSAFNQWDAPDVVSMMWFQNDGKGGFVPHIVAREPIQLLTADVGDFDGNGNPVLLTGGFHAMPPWNRMSRISLWRHRAP